MWYEKNSVESFMANQRQRIRRYLTRAEERVRLAKTDVAEGFEYRTGTGVKRVVIPDEDAGVLQRK